ncbi:hypothetical protein [Enterococcus sp. AZ109]|uniref:hypothetical protein n=1 Tax=Enterococcus sp. AZ109 TaxID=2774634 RepID=UPI003F686FB7
MAGLLLGVVVLVLLVFVGISYRTIHSASPDDISRSSRTSSTSTEANRSTTSSSILTEAGSILEGYYWEGYLDQREKIQDPAEVENYHKPLLTSQLTDELQNPSYYWYRLDDVTTDVPNGSYVRVMYKGPIREVYPAIVSDVVKVEIID